MSEVEYAFEKSMNKLAGVHQTLFERHTESPMSIQGSDDITPDCNWIIELVVDGTIAAERARAAYRETLEIALEEVESLLKAISGRVVISADHGEHFGEPTHLF